MSPSLVMIHAWSKHRFTATHGVVAVIAWDSGQGLDFEIMLKHCGVCARNVGMDEMSEKLAMWCIGMTSGCL